MANKGTEVQGILKTLDSEQRNGFKKLVSDQVPKTNGQATASCSNSGRRFESNSDSSDDDVIILDDSEEEDGVVELMEVSSEVSSNSSSSKSGPMGDSLGNGFLGTPTNPPDASTSESEEESEESEHDWEIITIEDDDDGKPRIAPKEMSCFRCPNKRVGTFKDERKYWSHISRHVLPDIFSCVTCQRSFHKLTHCLSHELRVHGTPIGYEIKDKVISKAKSYIKERQSQKSENNTQNINNDDEIDCEDVTFYGDHFVCSSSIYRYRGPEVNTMLEAYEIQYTYAPRRKTPRINQVAKLAIDIHEQNVQKKNDMFRLGRFSNRKDRFNVPVAAKKNSKKMPKTAAIPVPAQVKRPRDVISESESTTNEKPSKKRARIRYLSLSSSSDSESSDDLDYVPSEEKPKNIKNASDNVVAGSSGAQQKKRSRKRQSEEPEESSITKRMCFTALLKRVCQLCNYVWETENELRGHRDEFHPNIPLRELMAVPVPVRKQKSTKKLKGAENEKKLQVKKGTKETKKTAAGKRKSNKSSNTSGAVKSPTKKKALRKGRSQPAQRRPIVPEPDQSFSPKELFLHNFGLINCVRLQLHQNTSLAALNLPQCNVVLTRMTDSEIAVYKSGGASSLQDYLPSHFLLG